MKKTVSFLSVVGLLFLLFAFSGCIKSENVKLPAETVSPTSTTTVKPVTTPEPTPEPTTTPEPTATPTPAPTPFSIIWLTDTQSLAYHNSPLLESLGEGIRSLLETRNGVAVIHTGDIVDNGFKPEQWDNFSKTEAYFTSIVPYYPIAGNHDMGVKKQKYYPFINTGRLDHIPDEQKFASGIIYYSFIEEGDTRIMLLCASYDALRQKGAYAWLDNVMNENINTPCILVTHGYLTPRMNFPGTNWDHIVKHNRIDEEKVVSRYSNIRLVLCGHVNGYISAQHRYDDDNDGITERTVNALLINYTEREYYAYRLLTFDPVTRSIAVETFSADPDAPIKVNEEEWGPINFTIENAF